MASRVLVLRAVRARTPTKAGREEKLHVLDVLLQPCTTVHVAFVATCVDPRPYHGAWLVFIVRSVSLSPSGMRCAVSSSRHDHGLLVVTTD